MEEAKNLSEIAVLDLSSLSGKYEELDESVFQSFSQQFGNAMHTIGFSYLVNHGIDMDKIEEIHSLSKTFYSLPTQVKMKYCKTNPVEVYHGYAGPGAELINEEQKYSTELRESFDFWGFEQYDESKYPEGEVPGYKASLDGVRNEINNLTKKLLRSLGIYLKLEDSNFFLKMHRFMDDPSICTHSQFRTLNYFSLDGAIPKDAIRCAEHSDWGMIRDVHCQSHGSTITLLFQDMVGGLEVMRGKDGTNWIHAEPIKDSILVNCGQLLEFWSAGVFPATMHRVRIVDDEKTRSIPRQSFIYFIAPDGNVEVKPIVNKCPPGNESFLKEPTINAYAHALRRIKDATKHY